MRWDTFNGSGILCKIGKDGQGAVERKMKSELI